MITKSQQQLLMNSLCTNSWGLHVKEKHLQRLKDKLSVCIVCEDTDFPKDRVGLNTTFALKMPFGFVYDLQLVMPEMADPEHHKISVLSSLGLAVFGNKKGDKIKYYISSTRESAIIAEVGKQAKKYSHIKNK